MKKFRQRCGGQSTHFSIFRQDHKCHPTPPNMEPTTSTSPAFEARRPPAINTFKLGTLKSTDDPSFVIQNFEGTLGDFEGIMRSAPIHPDLQQDESPHPTTDTTTCPGAPSRPKPSSARQLFPPLTEIRRTTNDSNPSPPPSPPVVEMDGLTHFNEAECEAIINTIYQGTVESGGGLEDWGGDMVHILLAFRRSHPGLAHDIRKRCCPGMDMDQVLRDSPCKRAKVIDDGRVGEVYCSTASSQFTQ